VPEFVGLRGGTFGVALADNDEAWKDEVAPEGSPFRPLYDDSIKFNGQPIALVVAGDWETAKFAATLVRVEYRQQAFATDLEAERGNAAEMDKPHQPRGDAATALVRAAVRHEADYVVPTEHHNPMELYASTVVWEGDGRLTVYDKTQGVQNVHKYLCSVFDKKPEDIRVLSPYVGGAFGSGLRPQYQVVLATLAALALKRSVRVVLTRQQMYGLGYRPMTIERVALGAKPDGTLDAVTHEAIAVTSRYEDFSRNDTGWAEQLYKSPNARFSHKLVHLDVSTPCDMRAPGAASGVCALECAMDTWCVAGPIVPVSPLPIPEVPIDEDAVLAAAKRLGWIVAHVDPLILGAETVGAVLVLLLRSTNNDNMRFDLVVDRNGGTDRLPIAL